MKEIKTKTVPLEIPNGFSPMVVISEHEGMFTASVFGDGHFPDKYCSALLSFSVFIAEKIQKYFPDTSQEQRIEMVFERCKFLLKNGSASLGKKE